jgi:RNA polymerase sigma-70 factor (ECF subfamily)
VIDVAQRAGARDAVVDAAMAGDEAAFARLVARHEHELRAHCYRMVRSVADADDLVQETFLRAWRSLSRFEGRSTVRSWLYRIATNVCLDAIERRSRGPRLATAPGRDDGWTSPVEGAAAPPEAEPDARVVTREAVELALLASIEHLPARQRAVLILRDVFGWSACDSASLLGTTVEAANSALQRARATMRSCQADGDWGPTVATAPTRRQRAVVRRLVDAHERADGVAAAVLARAAG